MIKYNTFFFWANVSCAAFNLLAISVGTLPINDGVILLVLNTFGAIICYMRSNKWPEQ